MKQVFSPDVRVKQICYVTDDVERTAAFFAGLLGLDPPTEYAKAADRSVAKAVYRGEENADVQCKIAIFKLGNIDIEILQPDGRPSAWQELLDKNGPCVHHIAFATTDMERDLANLQADGAEMVQQGDFVDSSGQYAYVDTVPQLGAFIELLERY